MIDLAYDENRPLIAMVTRLTEQKGMDLVAAVVDEIMRADVQMVVLGTGDWKYENMIKRVQEQYPAKFRAILQFSSDIASKLYGAADIFLMPSKFEPCGLSQMIAMRYGTVPVVRETGGLKDTVEPYNPVEKTGVGFTFKTYNSYDMLDAVWRAYGTFFDKENWKAVVSNGMKKTSVGKCRRRSISTFTTASEITPSRTTGRHAPRREPRFIISHNISRRGKRGKRR